MKRTEWTDEHDRLLAGTSPSVEEPTEADLARAWSRVEAAVASGRERQRHPWRVTVGIAVGAVVLGTSGIAAADLFSARTGQGPSDREDTLLGGPGERLDPSAPDFGEVIAQETADIPFPDESSRAFAIADQVHDARFALPGSERVSTGAIRAWVADAAVCAWSNQWAAGTRDGDNVARTEALLAVETAPGWPAVTSIDPEPYSRLETVNSVDRDGNVTGQTQTRDESQFYYLGPLRDAMEGRDPSAVADVLRESNGYCRPELVPDLPSANPMDRGR